MKILIRSFRVKGSFFEQFVNIGIQGVFYLKLILFVENCFINVFIFFCFISMGDKGNIRESERKENRLQFIGNVGGLSNENNL